METTTHLSKIATKNGIRRPSSVKQSASPVKVTRQETTHVGQIVIDQDNTIKYWNSFMETHSSIQSSLVLNRDLFELFEELKGGWFQRKCEQVSSQRTGVYITWVEKPFVFSFEPTQAFKGKAQFMYQNVSILPLDAGTKQSSRSLISIHDVTDSAVKRNSLRDLRA